MQKIVTTIFCLCATFVSLAQQHLGHEHEHEHDHNHQYNHHSQSNYEYADLRESDANIIGHVLDADNKEHMEFITIVIKGTTIGTTTDISGHYFLKNLPEGEYTLEASCIGYQTSTRKVRLVKGRTLEENFELEKDAILLDGIVVSANRNETHRREAPT